MSLTRLARLGQHAFSFLTLTASLAPCVACSAESTTDDVETKDDSPADDPGTPDGGSFEVVFEGEGKACGDNQCQNARIVGFSFGAEGCCADEAESTCGLDMRVLGGLLSLEDPGCEQLDKPGSASSDCPESEPITVLIAAAPAGGTVLPPCCQANGKCGFAADFGNIGFGCVDPSRFNQESGGSCDYEP